MKTGMIYVVDDDKAAREGLSRQLRSAGYQVKTFASAELFMAEPAMEFPCCLILDVKMPGITGPVLQEKLIADGNEVPILFLSGHANIATSVKAMKRGAFDFLEKPIDDQTLLTTVSRALQRSLENRDRRNLEDDARRRVASLTPREHEVLLRVIAGKLNKQIAGELAIVEKTVKFHRAFVMEKMGVSSVADLVRVAARAGINPV